VERVRAALAPRVAELVPLRERLVSVPLGLFHPVWIDPGPPDLQRHVRAVRAAVPGGLAQLGELVSRLMSAPLDRTWPLWELWVVDGLEPGRGALVLKLHHAIADGHSSERIISHLFGPVAGRTWPRGPASPAELEPSARAMVRTALGQPRGKNVHPTDSTGGNRPLLHLRPDERPIHIV
jgi:hypothetical protein